MDQKQIEELFANLTYETTSFLTSDNTKLTNALHELGKIAAPITPLRKDIFRAFAECPIESAKICIIGQDPFPAKDKQGNPVAHGLSYSTPKHIKTQKSTVAIYKCLFHCGLIKQIPSHGDLTNWAKQGVLLLNAYLTTELGSPDKHKHIWSEYTAELITRLKQRNIIFITLGNHAAKLVNSQGAIHWGHPSPLNTVNQDLKNPKNFLYCDAFIRANTMLKSRGLTEINWDPDVFPSAICDQSSSFPNSLCSFPNSLNSFPNSLQDQSEMPEMPQLPTTRHFYAFTDGAATGNGKEKCRASWAYYITLRDYTVEYSAFDIVENIEIKGEKYTASNNRGELLGIYNAIKRIAEITNEFDRATIVSDSQYSINCVNDWGLKWIANPVKHELSKKKNMDIIEPAILALRIARKKCDIQFKHVRSHKQAPSDKSSTEYFLWSGNDCADKLCTSALSGNRTKSVLQHNEAVLQHNETVLQRNETVLQHETKSAQYEKLANLFKACIGGYFAVNSEQIKKTAWKELNAVIMKHAEFAPTIASTTETNVDYIVFNLPKINKKTTREIEIELQKTEFYSVLDSAKFAWYIIPRAHQLEWVHDQSAIFRANSTDYTIDISNATTITMNREVATKYLVCAYCPNVKKYDYIELSRKLEIAQ
jgi:uracil-DNA glycosylase